MDNSSGFDMWPEEVLKTFYNDFDRLFDEFLDKFHEAVELEAVDGVAFLRELVSRMDDKIAKAREEKL